MFKRLTRYGRTLAWLLRVRSQQDALVRALEDLQLQLYEKPPKRLHQGAERDALMNEVVRIQRGLTRVSAALTRVELAARQWFRDATPPDQREPELVFERPNWPQPQSPFSPDVTPEELARRKRELREAAQRRVQEAASEPGERRIVRKPKPRQDTAQS